MNDSFLVYRDCLSDIDDLVARMQQTPLALSLEDVTVERPGRAIEGENWAPQLAPYEPWVHDASLDEPGAAAPEGTDGDLLVVGALGMGITDEERLALIGEAVHGKAPMTPHQMWEAGVAPLWRGGAPAKGSTEAVCETSRNRETLSDVRETQHCDRETSCVAEDAPEQFAVNVPVSVREDGDGYALSAVHLSALAEHGLPADGLVVAVPSFVDGRPVTRIASEAFARRYTMGAQVRLLMVPDTVEVVSPQAFGTVCAEVVHLGAGVRVYEPAPLDLAMPNPRLAGRSYRVSPRNEQFFTQGGCLVQRLAEGSGAAFGTGEGGTSDPASPFPTRLLFADAPYGERLAVAEGVQVVAASALAKSCPPPRVIDAPASLRRVDGAVDPETVWRAHDPAAMERIAARCGGRVASRSAQEQDGCWYDFAGGEARLVAGPPAPDSPSRQFSAAVHARVQGGANPAVSSEADAADAPGGMPASNTSSDCLSLPAQVGGRPLAVIAERALLTAPPTLILPDTVRTVADGNTCKGTRKLVLSEGLRSIGAHCFCSRTLEGPVLIPASVASIGEGSFEYSVVCLAAAGGAVVHITSDQLLSCFLADAPDGIPFDFARYDAQLVVARGLPDPVGALLHRLAAPFRLEDEAAARIVEALRERADEALAYAAREGDIKAVRALAERGFLDEEYLFNRQIERLRASNRTDCVLFLMDWRRRKQQAEAPAPKKARDRFAL